MSDKKLLEIIPEHLHEQLYNELQEKMSSNKNTKKGDADPDVVASAKKQNIQAEIKAHADKLKSSNKTGN